MVAVGDPVATTTAVLDLPFDLLLGATVMVAEQHVLEEVGDFFLATPVGIRPVGHRDADVNIGLVGKPLVPNPEAVGEVVGLEAGKGIGGGCVFPGGGRGWRELLLLAGTRGWRDSFVPAGTRR